MSDTKVCPNLAVLDFPTIDNIDTKEIENLSIERLVENNANSSGSPQPSSGKGGYVELLVLHLG